MGIHEWSYDNYYSEDGRFVVPHADQKTSLKDLKMEVELNTDEVQGSEQKIQSKLNCLYLFQVKIPPSPWDGHATLSNAPAAP